MKLDHFLKVLGIQKPLIAIQGDIFDTPADHIAFAVHYPNDSGNYNNAGSGFAALVAKHGWPELSRIKFEAGVPQTKKIKGKFFHALPVHCNQENGWDNAPRLIEHCLNKLPVDSTEVISTVLIGGGNAGLKYGATVKNIEGIIRSYKTVVLYVKETNIFNILVATGVVSQCMNGGLKLIDLPKVIKYREAKELIA